VPKEEGDADAKLPTPADNDSTSNDTSAAATPQDGAEASTRPPVQRLGGLRSAEPSSRSASPSVKRGSTKTGKKVMPKPMFTGRRSKEERAALEKEQLEREKVRNRDQEKEAAFQARRKEREAAKEASRATRGRGGYSNAMSGPFSLGSSKEGRGNRTLAWGYADMYTRPQGQPSKLLRVWSRIRLTSSACQK
jgi:DNA-directed RNA polymerase III subunit RPC4